MSAALEALNRRLADLNALEKAGSILQWDRQVLMPEGGAEARTAHNKALMRMWHQLFTSDETQNLVEKAGAEVDPESDEAGLLRVVRRNLSVQTKLPSELVARKTQVSSDAYEAWRAARAANDFRILQPFLEELFDINREVAELRGYQDHIYDALIDLFEEGSTRAQAKALLDPLKEETRVLLDEMRESQGAVDDSFLAGNWDQEKLRSIMEQITREIGFDYNRGRLDITTNAFCTNFSRGDVRMTTRPSGTLKGIAFSSLHEMGHGLYEQGSPAKWDRTPLAGGVSMVVHESQSRTWENTVGRSRPFWQRFWPRFTSAFPELAPYSAEQAFQAVAKVQPGLVRIGSDEVTYNLHIIVRFELECEILTNVVAVKDLPEAWNEKMRAHLGVVPSNDTEGCLQDVHWSRGSVGYFPTYAMGNLLGAQIWEKLSSELGDTDALIRDGKFDVILGWLQDRLYGLGKRYSPAETVRRVTGGYDHQAFVRTMRRKYGLMG
ncbi:MAG: carboxypeptidase M32 [Fimbriimonadales bacterium]